MESGKQASHLSMSMITSSKLVKISKLLLYATAVLPFVLMARFSFPYVTVRTAIFRIIIELVAIILFWLYLQNKTSGQNWKKTYLLWVFSALLGVELLAAIFGQSWRTSFFSDLERMWGVFTAAHLLVFYCLLRAWFKEKDWVYFFRVSLVTSLLVSIYGIIQHFPGAFGIYVFEAGASRIPSTLGNPTYVAIYLLFNMAFAFYLLTQDKRKWRYFYWLSLAVNFYTFSLTDIRGAYLGIIAGTLLAAFLYLWLGQTRQYRLAAGAALAVVFLIGAMVAAIRITKPDNAIPFLSRLSTISLQDGSVQTRFIGWNAAWQSFKERPLLGVGMENYNLVFNKYFPARYYNLAPSETYFDRSHNHYLNILAESGVLALLLYLLLPAVAVFYLWRGYRLNRFTLPELSIFSALIVAYLVHLFFVFEEINAALFFVALLAFIEYRYSQGNIISLGREARRPINGAFKVAAAAGIVALVFSIYNLNWKVLQAARVNSAGHLAENVAKKLEYFSRSLSLNIIPNRNIAAGYAEYLVSLADQIEKIKKDQRISQQYQDALLAVIKALESEAKKKPNDVYLLMKLAQVQNVAYLFFDNSAYVEAAIVNLEQATTLSPGRLQLYYILGESYILADKTEDAIGILKKAVELNSTFGASDYYLGRAYLVKGDLAMAYDSIVNKSLGEKHYTPENNTILLALSDALAAKGKYSQVIPIYESVIKRATNKKTKAQFLAALAAAYVQIDDSDKAIASAQEAAELDPSFAEEADYFINMIRAGRIEALKQSTQ